jgi:hypothetical protein
MISHKVQQAHVHKLMQVMSEREMDRQLEGRVEIDDAYLGGELPGGKSGRGSENKVSFLAAVQTTDSKSNGVETGHPLKVCLKKLEFTKEAIAEWAKTALAASAHGVSDGLWCFQAVTAADGHRTNRVDVACPPHGLPAYGCPNGSPRPWGSPL